MTKGMIIKDIKIEWLGHSGFLLEHGKRIYIDPYKVKDPKIADVVLLTHDHYDHCSIEDLKRIVSDSTAIILPIDCISSLAGRVPGKTIVIEPGKRLKSDSFEIEAVPAYNLNKTAHLKQNNWLGYIITLNGVRIYHAGDTDRIPEMRSIRADVALLPVSGQSTMTAEEAALAASDINCRLAIPMHWGAGVAGNIADAERFKSLSKCDVRILEN